MKVAPPGLTVRQRVDVSCLARRPPLLPAPVRITAPPAPVTQVLQPPSHIEADEIPAPSVQAIAQTGSVVDRDVVPAPRVDVLPASYDPARWTRAELQQFRELQAEMLGERRRPTAGYEQALAELLKTRTLREAQKAANEKKANDAAFEREMAFEFFRCVPPDVLANQHRAQKQLRWIACFIAYALGRSEPEVRRRVGGYRKEFLRRL